MTIPVSVSQGCTSVSLTEDDIVEGTEAVNVSIQSVSPSTNFDPDGQLVLEILDNDGKNTTGCSDRCIVILSTRYKNLIFPNAMLVGMAVKINSVLSYLCSINYHYLTFYHFLGVMLVSK